MPGALFQALIASDREFLTVASNALSAGDNSGWASWTFVQFIPQSSLLVTGGIYTRLTIKAPAATGFQMTGMYIGQASASFSAASPAFASTPTQVLFGGSGNLTVAGGAADTVSDKIAFNMPTSNGLAIAWQFNATAATVSSSAINTPSGWILTTKNAADAATVAKSGYSDRTSTIMGGSTVKLVETMI